MWKSKVKNILSYRFQRWPVFVCVVFVNVKIKGKEYSFISFPTLACFCLCCVCMCVCRGGIPSFPDCAITWSWSTIKIHLRFDGTTGTASNNTISWSATYEIPTYFRFELVFVPQNTRFNVSVILMCSINGENNVWHVKSWGFTPE